MAGNGTSTRAGFHTATPYMITSDAQRAIEFYKEAFGAVELMRMADPDGRIRHAEIAIGDSPIMLVDEFPEFSDWKGPIARGGATTHIYLYVEDCDAIFNRALAAGAAQMLPLEDRPYGDRIGGLIDPFGHVWYVATHKPELMTSEHPAREETPSA